VHWFAYISEPLGLDAAQLDALRRQFLFENLPQEAFIAGMIVVPIVAAIVAVLAAVVWLSPRIRRKAAYALLVIASGVTTLAITFLLSLFLTRGFWD
jgi:FtsH-binding integral membrane protein